MTPFSPSRRLTLNLTASLLTLALAAGLAGCGTSKMTTGSIARGSGKPLAQMSNTELMQTSQSLGQAYTRDTKNREVALGYANVLQMSGQSDQALAVVRKLAIDLPKDRTVLAAYGKALAGAGQLEPALEAVRRAQTPEYPDWKLMSAEGAILDQLGQSAPARELYRKALDMKPNEPSVLSNLGMSYTLEGDLKTAETYLRTATQSPGADSRVRQNLALVVGLQGRFQEAEDIAKQELSPQQAEANVAYLRGMLKQQNAWSDIAAEDKAKKDKPATN